MGKISKVNTALIQTPIQLLTKISGKN